MFEMVANVLQDSGLTDSRLLARLLPVGVVLLDERARLLFASAGACSLFDAADEAALRERWVGIAGQLHLAGAQPRSNAGAGYGRADIATPAGTVRIRYELHTIAHDGRVEQVLLLRERDRLLPADRALILATEAAMNRHALSGLVHAAKGPLNNFNLTLALLATGIERASDSSMAAGTRTRWTRYIDVLRTETARLTGNLDELNALATPPPRTRAMVDVCALLREVVRVLHHDAAIREIDLEVEVRAVPRLVRGDPGLLRLALLSFTVTILELTRPDGKVVWKIDDSRADDGGLTIAVTTSGGALPPELAESLYRLTCTAESDHVAAIAARMIIEADGGDVAIDGRVGFRLRLPLARPADESPAMRAR